MWGKSVSKILSAWYDFFEQFNLTQESKTIQKSGWYFQTFGKLRVEAQYIRLYIVYFAFFTPIKTNSESVMTFLARVNYFHLTTVFLFSFFFLLSHKQYALQLIMNESDLSIKRPTSKSQQESLARIVKAQVTLLVSNLDNDNFTRKAAEIHSVSLSFKI